MEPEQPARESQWVWVNSQPSLSSQAFQAQGGESQQEAQRLQAQVNELQAQLSQKEQAAEHYKLQVRCPALACSALPTAL